MRVHNRILLIEDDAPLRRSLEKFLDQAGYFFHPCSTAGEALELSRKVPYDVVIVEYHLPDANGTALLQKLKLTNPQVTAILLSEYDFQAISKDLAHANVGWFLKKPFDLVDLENALADACSEAGLVREPDRMNNQDEGVTASPFNLGTLGKALI